MSMPTGQTCTHMVQLMQSPKSVSSRPTFSCARARLAALGVVGDDQGVGVEHRALEAGVGTHVFAHLFAHLVGKQPGDEAVEGGSKEGAAARLSVEEGGHEVADGGKPAGKGDARPGADSENQQVFAELNADFARVPRLFCRVSCACCGRLRRSGLSTA